MRTRMRHGLAAALTVSALCLTSACAGGSQDSEAKKPTDGQTATSAAPAPTTPEPAKPLTAAQMQAAALGVKDLPAGWKAAKIEQPGGAATADKPECAPIAAMLADKVSGAVMGPNLEFERDKGDTTLAQQVFTYQGSGATDYLKEITTALASCTSFTARQDGMKLAIKVEKLTAPAVGEEALAFRLKLDVAEASVKFEANMFVARQGAGVTRLAHLPADASGHKDFAALAELAGDKFTKAARS